MQRKRKGGENVQSVKVKRSAVKPLLAATFPDYRGRKIRFEFVERITYHDTNWGGGTLTRAT